jgi:hypothetical protein
MRRWRATSRYKLILRNQGKGANELYDETADPKEQTNQADNPKFTTMRERLTGQLDGLAGRAEGRGVGGGSCRINTFSSGFTSFRRCRISNSCPDGLSLKRPMRARCSSILRAMSAFVQEDNVNIGFEILF